MIIYRIVNCDDTPRSRHASAHDLLSMMLDEYTDHSYSELEVAENGKPYIDSVAFSLSHCCDVAIVAMSVDVEPVPCDRVLTLHNADCIGVDIECVDNKYRTKCEKIAHHKFFDSEKELLQSCCEQRYLEEFCRIWTQKESYSKFTGVGLKDALTFDTSCVRDDIVMLSEIVEIHGSKYVMSFCYNSITE